LGLIVAAFWLMWVRTLARERRERMVVAWVLFVSAIVLAAICFAMPGQGTPLIYGLRSIAGWAGFGPFPNRNHTACFLAMGALVGCGCVARAGARKQRVQAAAGIALIALILLALLQSQSRGGFGGCVVGLAVFGAMMISKLRDRKTVAVLVAGGFIAAALCMAFGANLFARVDLSRQ